MVQSNHFSKGFPPEPSGNDATEIVASVRDGELNSEYVVPQGTLMTTSRRQLSISTRGASGGVQNLN